MLYSKLLGKTKKEVPAEEVSTNAQLLIKGGYIQKEMAGVFAFLPLGLRVINNIVQIIREEMNAIGGQELHLGSLQNPETWQKSGRWDDSVIDVWFKTQLANQTEVGLANTHEEPLTQIMTQHVQSYKDLPLYAYQFQTKFRNELRSKSGILRTKEFLMKDLYSFNADQKGLDTFYETAKKAYHKVFERVGIGNETYITFASGGAFSKYSHEFQTVCEQGEDTVYLDREKNIAINKEVYTDEVIADLGLSKDSLEEVSAIEVGNIFKLGTKFSDAIGLTYVDENDEKQAVVMGSYGIGPARTMATVVQLNNDDKGIIWPESIAPYKVHLVGLNLENENVENNVYKVYETLQQNNIEVLFDDRLETRAGEKFADSDLIGCPFRAVVSAKSGDQIEFKKRTDENAQLIDLDKLVNLLSA